MTSLKDLRAKRGIVKGSLTRFKTYYDKIASNPIDVIQLEIRVKEFETLINKFDTIQTEIELKDSETSPEDQSIERELFENEYFEYLARAKGSITQLSANLALTSDSPTSSVGNNSNKLIKLPPIPLPTFDGSYDQWLYFRDTFASIIHEDKSLSDIQKFHYLRLSLKNEASELLKSLEISNENYKIAWDILVNRFENKKLLVNNHLKALFQLPELTKESQKLLQQLHDGLNKHLRALETLEQPVRHWDTIIIYLIVNKLDPVTRREWESPTIKIKSGSFPTINELLKFLEEKCKLLETLNSDSKSYKSSTVKSKVNTYVSTDQRKCSFCTQNHIISECEEFLKLSPDKRFKEAKQKQLCVNCLRDNHATRRCKIFAKCTTCQKRHHSLLHFPENHNSPTMSTQNQQNNENAVIPIVNAHSNNLSNQVLLSTAIVKTSDKNGNFHSCRVLLDSGSQSNFITTKFADTLNLPRKGIEIAVSGLNSNLSKIRHSMQLNIMSIHNRFNSSINCLIIPKITDNLPSNNFDKSVLNIPRHIKLADPSFNISSDLDMLIGADTFWQLLQTGQVSLGKHKPILQETLLGWVVSGQISHKSNNSKTRCNLVRASEIDRTLQKFWELENIDIDVPPSEDNKLVESFYKATTRRDPTGRFIVKLPLKQYATSLGESKQIALKRFYSMEKKLNKDSQLKENYTLFMEEYLALGHMTRVSNDSDKLSYYIPHHFVKKDNSITTKIRVVFDASCKSNNGISLNDLLHVGPKLQTDLLSVILRFRMHKYVLTGDITKMYRQILIDPDDKNLQKILWRSNSNEPVSTFTLNTVTYGIASAPFLAIRCLHELAYEHQYNFPASSKIIQNDFYVDDLLTGSDDIQQLELSCNEVTAILKSGGFSLNKWASNSPYLLSKISNSNSNVILNIGDNNETHALGLLWHSNCDQLSYKIRDVLKNRPITKRTILSVISQIYDPLGLIGPVIIVTKILLQKLWQLQISWDDNIPPNLSKEWMTFHNHLPKLSNLTIPRYIKGDDANSVELIGFSDASQVAYGACVYIRSVNNSGEVKTNLLCAKSKVAPMKSISIPRLELCAALLLSKLIKNVKAALNINFKMIYLCSDSTVTLSWLNSEPCTWKVFIANRVSQIQNLTLDSEWYYVKSDQNPADWISRGVCPTTLINLDIWWYGPTWLKSIREDWHLKRIDEINSATDNECNKEIRKSKSTVLSTSVAFNIFNKYSSYTKLQRVIAYIRRFKQNALTKTKNFGCLTVKELNNATNTLVKLAQLQMFGIEIDNLNRTNSVQRGSRLLPLNPFIDSDGILRVGGRLNKSSYSFYKKHPVLLNSKHPLSLLLVRSEHLRLLHAGSQLLLASLREKFWILSGRNLTRKVIHDCVKCFRTKPTNTNYLMADLPSYRVMPEKPFGNCGVDYCGPFKLRDRPTRNYKVTKAYVCIYICMVTKAIHMELVSDLTSEKFLGALKRFVARRGKVKNIFSDNATTFKGAQSELHKLLKLINNTVSTEMHQEGISWNFIPSRSPHMGGIWEAGVKSFKSHFKRVVGDSILTFEEFNTVVTQIEACLNSRPLSPLSNDPNDLLPLTPGHFLIGQSLMAIPEPTLYDVNENRLSRFQRVEKMKQHFWKRWSKEYISELQVRKKWHRKNLDEIKQGQMVIIKEDNLPPLKWSLGRVLQVHPGSDDVVRVVTVKTNDGVYTRPVTKICILPISDNNEVK